jgi:hypothetical protein
MLGVLRKPTNRSLASPSAALAPRYCVSPGQQAVSPERGTYSALVGRPRARSLRYAAAPKRPFSVYASVYTRVNTASHIIPIISLCLHCAHPRSGRRLRYTLAPYQRKRGYSDARYHGGLTVVQLTSEGRDNTRACNNARYYLRFTLAWPGPAHPPPFNSPCEAAGPYPTHTETFNSFSYISTYLRWPRPSPRPSPEECKMTEASPLTKPKIYGPLPTSSAPPPRAAKPPRSYRHGQF